jgi:hypothetical protein
MFYWRGAAATVNPELIECSAFCSSFVLYFVRDFYSGQSGFVVERILHEKSVARSIFPPEGIPTLTQWWGLCCHMIPRAMLAVANATGRASHARQVKGDDPDKKGYPGPPGGGLEWA